MRSSIKGLIGLAALSSALSVGAPAFAQDAAEEPAPPITVTGGVTVVTDYRFRGVSFTNEDFAVQPTITLNHESGVYIGVWGSNLDDTPVFGTVEVDLYAGYTAEVASGTNIDVGVVYYWYPGGDSRAAAVPPATIGAPLNSDYFEPYASIKTTLGPVSAKFGVAYAFDQAALGDADNLYLYTDLTLGVPNTPVTLVGHLGYSDGALAFGGSYWDWALGADVSFAPFTVGVRYVDTDLDNLTGVRAADTLYDETILFTLGVTF
jgi:uncharacterized protein (TIGR02001 family)